MTHSSDRKLTKHYFQSRQEALLWLEANRKKMVTLYVIIAIPNFCIFDKKSHAYVRNKINNTLVLVLV